MMKYHDLSDRAVLEEEIKIANKVGFRTHGASFEKMEVPELPVTANASEITTNGKLNMTKTKEVIAQGGELEFSEPSAPAPRWTKVTCEKATQCQKLAAMKPEKK